MKTKILQTIALTLLCIGAFSVARAQTNTNDLTLDAEAQILQGTNETRVFLTIHLVNSTDHEVTVLTKHLNVGTDYSTNRVTFVVGYGNSAITHDGHAIVPSLYDFSPATLKPDEEAVVTQELPMLRPVMSETKCVVKYTISPEWARRFALWSGSVESKPFSARIRKPR
ncbi:MAG: hypothetical protein JWR26_4870 [Pedosphaera sp.]|nr:hypothetical protein [Pedosphaera sp.]